MLESPVIDTIIVPLPLDNLYPELEMAKKPNPKKPASKSLTATDLRKLAESADGTRGTPVYFQVKPDSLNRIKKPATGTYLTVLTPWQGKGLRATERITVTRCKVSKTADAVFTSQSSFEKFALPYYVRTKTLDELKDMLSKFYEEGVVCVYHEPDSESTAAGKKDPGLHVVKADV